MPQNENSKERSQVFWIVIIVFLFITLVTVSAVCAYVIMLQPFDSANRNGEDDDLGPIYTMDEFVVNVGSIERRRICRAVMAFELKDLGVIREIEKREAKLRNNIIATLRVHTMDVLERQDDASSLRQLITDEMNSILGEGSVNNTWFTEFFVE